MSKSVKISSDPFERVKSPKCQRWRKFASNSSIFERDLTDVMCQPCKKMCSYLDQLVRTAVSVTPARKASRQDPSSTCPISSLSPASQKKRKYNLMHERVEDKKRLRKYEHTELTLDDEQSDELSQIVQIISTESHGHTVLSQIFDEAGQRPEIWESDIRSQFEKD